MHKLELATNEKHEILFTEHYIEQQFLIFVTDRTHFNICMSLRIKLTIHFPVPSIKLLCTAKV